MTHEFLPKNYTGKVILYNGIRIEPEGEVLVRRSHKAAYNFNGNTINDDTSEVIPETLPKGKHHLTIVEPYVYSVLKRNNIVGYITYEQLVTLNTGETVVNALLR